jgi:superfamily I DNA/RNA helicase
MYESYQKTLKEKYKKDNQGNEYQEMDFDDQMRFAHWILKEKPDYAKHFTQKKNLPEAGSFCSYQAFFLSVVFQACIARETAITP